MDHFIHEKTDFRLLLIRWLTGLGWRSLAEELSWSDGRRVDRFLNSGREGELERLAGLGYEADLRIDRLDRPTGILKASFDLYPVDLFRAEQLRFYRALRQIGGPWDFHGFDVDALPGGAYADIRRVLAPWASSPRVESWLDGLARIPEETRAQEAARLRGLELRLDGLADDIDRSSLREARLSLAALADTLDYIDLTYAGLDYASLSPGLARREDILKRQAAAVADEAPEPGAVFMAHALHLLKDDRLGGHAGAAGPGGGQARTVGHFLAQERGLRAFSVWLLWGAGEDSQPFPDLPRRFDYPAATLNAALARFTGPVIFPVTGAPTGLFDRPWPVAHMYNAVADVTLQGQVDAILFLPAVRPMQLEA